MQYGRARCASAMDAVTPGRPRRRGWRAPLVDDGADQRAHAARARADRTKRARASSTRAAAAAARAVCVALVLAGARHEARLAMQQQLPKRPVTECCLHAARVRTRVRVRAREVHRQATCADKHAPRGGPMGNRRRWPATKPRPPVGWARPKVPSEQARNDGPEPVAGARVRWQHHKAKCQRSRDAAAAPFTCAELPRAPPMPAPRAR